MTHDETEIQLFKKRISPIIGIDLEDYKSRQMERRILAMMTRANVQNLRDYYMVLTQDSRRLREFVDGLTINVSEFFRNSEKFDELRDLVLPDLFSRFGRLKIWSAGCSIGAEIYSVAILLDQIGAAGRCDLWATDVDLEILGRARAGLFYGHEIKSVRQDLLEQYFMADDEGYQLSPSLMRRVNFRQHNLLREPPLDHCHLILCRNVVIYFTDPSKQSLYKAFNTGLEAGGVLFIGGTERIFNYRDLGFEQYRPFFYRKVKTP